MDQAVAARRGSRFAVWRRILGTCGCDDTRGLDPVARALLITRACVQPMTLTAMAIAGLLAAESADFDGLLFTLAVVGSVVAHAANNVVNDLFDLSSGLDESSYPRAQYAPHPVLSGVVTRKGLAMWALALNAIDAAIMTILWLERGWVIVLFALVGLFLSFFYVAPPLRLKARGLGEPTVAIVWGPLMVGGTYYAATGELAADVLWASVPYALLTTTVLMGKHIDKLPWDKRAGVTTLPVALGDRRARIVTSGLMVGFYVSVVALVVTRVLSAWTLVVVLGARVLAKALRTYRRPPPAESPRGYPLWPLWYGPWAFVHARAAGILFVVGLTIGALV